MTWVIKLWGFLKLKNGFIPHTLLLQLTIFLMAVLLVYESLAIIVLVFLYALLSCSVAPLIHR
jgi:hypothetical protein